MGDQTGAYAWRQLRGMSAIAARFRRARPPMVPRQPSAPGGAPCARPALGIAASSSHRDRIISYGPALAIVSGVRNSDLLASPVRAAGIFSKRVFAIP